MCLKIHPAHMLLGRGRVIGSGFRVDKWSMLEHVGLCKARGRNRKRVVEVIWHSINGCLNIDPDTR